MTRLLLLVLSCTLSFGLFGQLSSERLNENETIARTFLQSHYSEWQLTPEDVAQLRLKDIYSSSHNGVTHVYFAQQYHGIDIEDGSCAVHIKGGKVVYHTNSLIAHIGEKIHAGSIALQPETAVQHALTDLGYSLRGPLVVSPKSDRNRQIFEAGSNSAQDIITRLTYTRNNSREYVLTWSVALEPVGDDMWDIRVSAETGEVIRKYDRTVHCAFPKNFLAGEICNDEMALESPSQSEALTSATPQYNVVPIPGESPNHHPRVLISDPSDPNASPYGWHDLDGVEGADTTITLGNNVFAMLDRNGDYSPDFPLTSGGSDLNFDFDFDEELEPVGYTDADVTNLFYMNNVMHDFTYQYGFDEFAGNFQKVNYTNEGFGNDHVMAHGQFAADLNDPDLQNNADFGTPGDGGNGRMRMFVWEGANANQLLRVDEPLGIAGTLATSTTSGWGVAITNQPVTAEVAIVQDASGAPTQGCYNLTNAEDIDGKIALIDRGNCEFGTKALKAQDAGAIGFIICNFEEGLVNMGGGSDGGEVTIPGVFISNSDCQRIRAYASNGLVVSLINESLGTGPSRKSGSFDNGVIAHEYGHGISNRLTDGPSSTGCLTNYPSEFDPEARDGEQMGEGWSDFFTLVTTAKPGDTGPKRRGIGTYADGRDTASVGIRPFPYSTDMNINPMTYDDIAFYSVPHGVGTVWCTMLWDLYWALSDEYGWDPDLYYGTGGNNLAIQLVMDGMKLQPCHPGFVDGRDAILNADTLLTGGQNGKLIWEVFARRGLGWSATQGVQEKRFDGKEAFDLRPGAIEEVKISKDMTAFIEPGEQVEVTLTIWNYTKDQADGLVVTDAIPDGMTYMPGSASMDVETSQSELVFDLGSMDPGSSAVITYKLSSAPTLFSDQVFFDDMENGDFNWNILIDQGDQFWTLQDAIVNSGDYAWGVPNPDTTSDQSLVLLNPITLSEDKPVLRFYNYYDTERFLDAGILMVSTDNGFKWNTVAPDKVIRGDLSGKIGYGLFAIPNLSAWHGQSSGWIPTLVDLSDYAGQSVILRWRFGSDEEVGGALWAIDDVEVMDAFNYNSTACITQGGNTLACAEAPRWGTLVASSELSGTSEALDAFKNIRVYPNPVSDLLNVDVTPRKPGLLRAELISGTGQVIDSREAYVQESETLRFRTSNLAGGLYFVSITSAEGQSTYKVIVE